LCEFGTLASRATDTCGKETIIQTRNAFKPSPTSKPVNTNLPGTGDSSTNAAIISDRFFWGLVFTVVGILAIY